LLLAAVVAAAETLRLLIRILTIKAVILEVQAASVQLDGLSASIVKAATAVHQAQME
jgi:hypothetical protein